MLIGLAGRKGSGKDTAGAYLAAHHNFTCASFARPLKESAAALLNVSVTDLESWKNDPAKLIELVDDVPNRVIAIFTIREFLQRYGTEAHRDIFGEDFWVDQAFSTALKGRVVFTDTRFANEMGAIRERSGYIIHIERPGTDTKDTHLSEQQPVGMADFTLRNDGTKEDLYARLDDLVAKLTYQRI